MSSQNDTLRIRSLTASDRAAWQDLWASYLAFYESSVSTEVYDTTFSRLLGDDERDYSCFVAELEGTLVGLVHFLFHRHCWKIEDTCYLQDLYAHPNVRGRGIGTALIKAVYDAADQAASPSVYWMTQDHNVTARKLYDQVGQLSPFIKYQRP